MGNLFLLAFVFIRDKILAVHFLSLACKIFFVSFQCLKLFSSVKALQDFFFFFFFFFFGGGGYICASKPLLPCPSKI